MPTKKTRRSSTKKASAAASASRSAARRGTPLVPGAPPTNRHVIRMKRANVVKMLRETSIHAGKGYVDQAFGRDPSKTVRSPDFSGNLIAALLAKVVGDRVTVGTIEHLAVKRGGHGHIDLSPKVHNLERFLRQCRKEMRDGVSPLIVLTRVYEALYQHSRANGRNDHDNREEAKEKLANFAKRALPTHIDIELGRLLPRGFAAIRKLFEILQ